MNQRVSVIDGLRGVSLLGILIANMLIFQYGMFGKDRIENFPLSSADHIAYVWTKIFIENSFFPIFMFLFGYSIIKLKEQLEKNDKKVKPYFVRRFFLLMIIVLRIESHLLSRQLVIAKNRLKRFIMQQKKSLFSLQQICLWV